MEYSFKKPSISFYVPGTKDEFSETQGLLVMWNQKFG